MEGRETLFVQEMRKLMKACVMFGVCFVSDHPSDYVNTIQTLRTATVLSRIPAPKTTCIYASVTAKPHSSCPMTLLSSRSAPQTPYHEGSDVTGSHLSGLRRQGEPVKSSPATEIKRRVDRIV